jgi:glycosyltransferase involved in cell wall biosynthesis
MEVVDVVVVLPVYNSGRQVCQALDCLLKQTVQPADIIAVDDGSTDKTSEILSEYECKYDNVHVLTHETNQGLPTALNTAIEATNRTYIARQDADDRSVLGRIEVQYQYMMNHPEVDVVGGAAEVIDSNGNVRDTIYPPLDPSSVLPDRNPFVHGSVMMRREAIEDVGGYDPLFEYSQDYDLWTRLDRAGFQLDSIQTVLYELKRSQGHNSIKKRQRQILFGLAARCDSDQKERYRSVIREQDIRDIYELLPRSEKAVYNRQSSKVCIKRGSWTMAIQEVMPAILHDPLSIWTSTILCLSLLPPPVSRRILRTIQPF